MGRPIVLVYIWWSLFVRLADADREAITSRTLLHGVARQTQHAGQTRLTVASHSGRRHAVVAALRRVDGFFWTLTRTAEQLTAEDRWRRILGVPLKKHLHRRERGPQPLLPPPLAAPTCQNRPRNRLSRPPCKALVPGQLPGLESNQLNRVPRLRKSR